MHIEVQERRGKRFYYLAHSFRDKGRVRRVRKYLGVNLSEGEIKERKVSAERTIVEQIESYRRIGDPLHTVLSPMEKASIEALIGKYEVHIGHLSEEDWLKFTELFAYDTNAIEGSTVTAREVKEIIEGGKWPNRSKEEIAETYGLSEAVGYIRKTREHLSISLIRKLHNIVFGNSKPYAGRLRGPGVEVVVADRHGSIIHRGAPQKKIVSLLSELTGWYNKNKNSYHPIVLAAVVHNQFENIHPFHDGNGRVGRLLLNNILLKHNMPPVNIELKNRQEYYSTLQVYEKEGNLRPTIELILKEYKKLEKTLKGV